MAQAEQVDVLIIGSGPSGTSTALHMVRNDPDWAGRIVIVDKAVHPREKLCGGGVTHMGQNVLARLGLEFEPANFEVKEVRLVYEDKSFSLYGNPVFRVVRRDEFDHWLVRTAEQLGVRVRQGEAVTSVKQREEFVEVVTDKSTIHATVVVAADGSRSFVRRALKWNDASRVARLLEVLTPEDARKQPEFRDGVAIFDFTPMSSGLQGYYWDFPSYVNGQPFMNRGVFDSRARPERPRANLKGLLGNALRARQRNLADYKLKGHPIRWWGSTGRFATDRVILVGDAAGVDPLFGEGISFALGYGEVAAEAIGDAFVRQDYSFATYRQRLRAHPLFLQLRVRTRLARLAYLLRFPGLSRLGWRLAPWVVRLSAWRDRDYVPAQAPEFKLTETVKAPGF